MSDEVWSARCKNKKNTVEQLKKITLNTDNAGQYQHDDVIKFIEQLKQVAKEQFNPLDKNNGMSKLFDKNRNTINNITTKDAYDYKDILKKSKDEASKASTKESTVKPDITTRQEAQDEADRLNQIYQAVLGIKEGFKDKLCKSGGTNALSSVLQQADGQNKSIDDYTLCKLAEARIAGAHRPKATSILKQIVTAITMQFDFRKKVMDNVELQKIMINKATAFRVTVVVSLLVVNFEATWSTPKATNGDANLGLAAKPSARSTPTTPTATTRSHTATWYMNMRRPTACECYVKDWLPVTNRRTRSVHSVDNLRLFHMLSTTTKRAPSQWTRTPAEAKRRRARKRRKSTEAEARAITTANGTDEASRPNAG